MEFLKIKKFSKQDIEFLNYIGDSYDADAFVYYVIYLGLEWPEWVQEWNDDDLIGLYVARWFDRKYNNTVVNNRRFLIRVAKKILGFNKEECEKFGLGYTLMDWDNPEFGAISDYVVVVNYEGVI
jgi:hypothetical protein